MPQWLNRWNRKMAAWLWWVVLVGVIASIPVMYARAQTESSADQTALVIDYRDLLQIGAGQGNPQQYVAQQLNRLKQAGVNGAVVYESTLEELSWAGETAVYSALEAATLQGKTPAAGDNRTYVLFLNAEHEQVIRQVIQDGFAAHGASVSGWSADGRKGVVIDMGKDDAMLRPLQPNPIEMKDLQDAGLWVVPRLSDRLDPFNPEMINGWLKSFKQYGVNMVVFDGDAVPGFRAESPGSGRSGVEQFAYMLKANGIGFAAFENLKVPVKGLPKLAKLIDYNVIRAHSITDPEMATIEKEQLEDRILLAVKDRNIRFVFLNAMPTKDPLKGKLSNPLNTIVDALEGSHGSSMPEGAVDRLKSFGFEFGVPHAFVPHHAPAETALRGLAMLGAVALVALVIGMFIPSLLSLAFVAGLVGGAALYVLRPTLMVQTLALFAAIAAPTAAVILLLRRLRARRADQLSAGRRLGSAVLLYIRTALLSAAAIPLVVAMLNHISYNLVLQQFRGVSALHLLPILLVAIYVFLYGPGDTVFGNARRILVTPITVVWIVALAVMAAAGFYYLTRTGNAGNVSGVELTLRSFLENTFGVRPRTKEFLLGHPIMLAGIFLALRYRWATVLLVFGTIGQLSMVDTFAHIHTPLILSISRVLLGLGIGLLIGLVFIAVCQIIERIWARVAKPRPEAA